MPQNWAARVSWGASPATRTKSPWYDDKVVKQHGRCAALGVTRAQRVHGRAHTLTRRSCSVFYDCFFLDGVRIALHDCVGVALEEDDQTARWQRATP